ncbi:MAG: NPCBM/NEW2 domain-containing protein [Planctomycetota bacterium]
MLLQLAAACGASAQPAPATLTPASGEAFAARLLGFDDQRIAATRPGSDGDGDGGGGGDARASLPMTQVVRWGQPAPRAPRPTVVLRQGSRLVAGPAWTRDGPLSYTGGAFTLRQSLLAEATIDRRVVAQVLFEAARDPSLFDAALQEASRRVASAQTTAGGDRVWLINGDAFNGALEQIDAGKLTLRSGGQPLEFDLTRVVLLQLEQPGEVSARRSPRVAIGLTDGGVLLAGSASLQPGGKLVADLVEGPRLQGRRAGAVCLVQPLAGAVAYLSDIEPLDYRHTPYFDAAWPYARDRGFGGRPLRAAGGRWLKGVAMHSSSRLVYRVPPTAERFDAVLAVADNRPGSGDAVGRGSVVARVLIARGGKFSQRYESGVIRGGGRPVTVSLDVAGAQAIALVVEDAGDGDTLDHAAWLDARFVIRGAAASNGG